MTFISNPKLKTKREKKPIDIYYDNLEEAYGNLPIPSDDYAEVRDLLENAHITNKSPEYNTAASEDIDELEHAIETIRQHYEAMAMILKKEQKYN